MERLKTKLAKKGTSDREFWQITKSHSGMTRQRRKAAPPAEDLAKYFAKKMSLPGEESKEVPEPAGAGSTWSQKVAGLQDHLLAGSL